MCCVYCVSWIYAHHEYSICFWVLRIFLYLIFFCSALLFSRSLSSMFTSFLMIPNRISFVFCFYFHFLYSSMLFIFCFLFFDDKSSFTACGSSLHWSIPFSFHFLIENSIKSMDFKCVFVVHRTFCFLFYFNLMFSVFSFHFSLDFIDMKKIKNEK